MRILYNTVSYDFRQTDYESDLYGDATDYRIGESRTHRTDFRSPGPSWENFISEEATNFLRSVPRNVPSYVPPRVNGFGPDAYRRLQYRPIRGSKFSPSVSCCDSDREQTPSPPSAAGSPNPMDHRMLGSDFHFPEVFILKICTRFDSIRSVTFISIFAGHQLFQLGHQRTFPRFSFVK